MTNTTQPQRPLRIIVAGWTGWIGRSLVAARNLAGFVGVKRNLDHILT